MHAKHQQNRRPGRQTIQQQIACDWNAEQLRKALLWEWLCYRAHTAQHGKRRTRIGFFIFLMQSSLNCLRRSLN